jgi:hypothetical protein
VYCRALGLRCDRVVDAERLRQSDAWYVSSPTAEGGVAKSETELCVKLQTLDLCAKSATVSDQFHLFFLGLYAGIPLPLIPAPSGI